MASPMEASGKEHRSQATESKAGSQEPIALRRSLEDVDLRGPETPTQEAKHMDGDGNEYEFPDIPPPFDWDGFERRYEAALRDADQAEQEILKEADNLSKYFREWASAASAHDDERAVKRLQTRRRFVNLSEEKMAQKQQHYDDVLRAFESALALLRST